MPSRHPAGCRPPLLAAAFASLLLAVPASRALQVTALSPQGEVARVRQVVAKFDEPASSFGDPKEEAPLVLSCSDAKAAEGTGRWTGNRQWVFDFRDDLPPGVTCTVTTQAGYRSPNGTELKAGRWQFSTGGPFVQRVVPASGATIEEDQAFVLRLNGPATPESLAQHVSCSIEGLGERVPVRLLEGAERAQVLKAVHMDAAATREPLRYAALACNRRLPPDAKVQLVYGRGVATPGGVANGVERRFTFAVRAPFAASFSCERENAQADCLPIRAMTLACNAPVERALAARIRLVHPQGTHTPVFDREVAADSLVDRVTFPGPFPERATFALELPGDFRDASGRPLRNAASFPLKVATGPLPPLAKFAAAPFGIVERFAEPGTGPLLPVTLRHVEPALRTQDLAPGRVGDLQPQSDAQILAWLHKVQRYDRWYVPREQARQDVQHPLPRPLGRDDADQVQARMLSLLAGQPGVRNLELPRPGRDDPRPFEVVGIPLSPGFHVVEIASPILGRSLLDERHGEPRTMYVRTTALVTNLAVHFKLGRENAIAWVTTLDRGKVVQGATVRVCDCTGKVLATAITDARGIAEFKGLSPEAPPCGDDEWRRAYFVSARATDAGGVEDLAFTFSDWHRGIEPWRFHVSTSSDAEPDTRFHTILARPLLRAGETLHFKHLARTLTARGFGLPARLPDTTVITHVGSNQRFELPIQWRRTAGGGLSAEGEFQVPPGARLGMYDIVLRGNDHYAVSGRFRVEEFRLPVFEGRITPVGSGPLVGIRSLPTAVQVNYVAGGAAASLPVQVSALVRPRYVSFDDYPEFSFQPPSSPSGSGEAADTFDERVVADKLPLTLDRNGAGRITVPDLPPARRPQELVLEASYPDPNGEIQTLRHVAPLWPAAVIAGIRTESWVSTRGKVRFQALALDLQGRPAQGVPLVVRAGSQVTLTSRKRMVGGFYAYDDRTEHKDHGTVCEGRSDSRGLLLCEAEFAEPGEVELVAVARDAQGREARAATSVWITRRGELWFGGENHDRIDVLPEKKAYEPGETARLQVRMPFRHATALVSVEREGVLDARVVQLRGDDPTVELKVEDGWGPNVYVSVLVLRGRLREVPWYSFFTWGFKAPREWWTAFRYERREYAAPTALVDLSRPSFRLGVAQLRVGTRAHQLAVDVKADQDTYKVRGTARVTIQVRRPDGQPAADAEVALAAVDQALLELLPNDSWKLLDAMLVQRAWGVETSTAHMEIIGRRHYGRKAVPAGGGGGTSPTRELLDTLLLWKPRVTLDAQGRATVDVPLNDTLSTFRIVAVADAGTSLFGTGQTTIRTAQDLQVIGGLPPLVREEDRFRAQVTLRNTTARAMKVEVTARATLLSLEPRTVDIPPGEAREVAWDVVAPAQLAFTRQEALLWEVEARDTQGGARDAIKLSQRILPAVPLTVQQATLVQLDQPLRMEVAPPADALPATGARRGGLRLAVQPRLADGLPGVREWFRNYPFTCLEQRASRAIGLRDATAWQALMAQLPTHLDADGLAAYFPLRAGDASRGSDTLTAYLLAAAHEAAQLDPAFALPDALRASMEQGLAAFVEGRIQRAFWSPRRDLDVRKLAAIEALSRTGKAQARMLGSITIAPDQWPTHAVIDWLNILRRLPEVPQREQRLAEASRVLKARLSFQGTRVTFSTEQDDHWWWLMQNADVNTARLILAVLDDPAWKDDMGGLAAGFIARQERGAWRTTTANLWGSLALEKFSRRFEAEPVTGRTRATLGSATAAIDAAAADRTATLPWPAAGRETLAVAHEGDGKPWLTVQSLAAVDLKAPFAAGFAVKKSVTPVEQAVAGRLSRGDVLRVRVEVDASADMTWVALTDPVPGGATILGSGLGRDSQVATQGERDGGRRPAFEERGFEAFRAYWAYVPRGRFSVEYTLRLNNVGDFALPPTRVEALYAPEMFGEAPNARVTVEAGR